MKIAVVSYSLTGNNGALAGRIAKDLSAGHIKITEPKSRTTGSIILDILFQRTPRTAPEPDRLAEYDLVLFAGPVWMGQAATPLRAYLKYLKKNPRKYAFISISGGALGPNPKLAREMKKRTGKDADAIIDLHIADLLPADPKPAMKDTSAYKINETDIDRLSRTIAKTVKETFGVF